MTIAARDPRGHRTSESDELTRLLELGPFPAALRAAIAASGLSLDRIQHRLKVRGVQISVATLSYWQSGRRRPERPSSLHALKHLEAVLQLSPGALSALLGPPRPRGRRTSSSELPAMHAFWDPKSMAYEMLSSIDTSTDLQLRRLSQHDRAVIGANRRMKSLFCRQVLRAETDGPDRWILIYDWETSADDARPIVSHLRNCTLGEVHTSPDSSLFCLELLFERPLQRGETLLLEYELRNPSADAPALVGADDYKRKFRQSTREYVLEVQFDPSSVPARTQQLSSTSEEGPAMRTRNLAVNSSGSVHAIAMDFGPGEFGIRWDWPQA